MNWLSQLSWWQLTLIVIALIWAGTFLFKIVEYWAISIHAAHYFTPYAVLFLIFFAFMHPIALWFELKSYLYTRRNPLEFGRFKYKKPRDNSYPEE